MDGIKSHKNSFEEIHIEHVFGKLTSMEGHLPTPKGNIIFNMKKKKGKLLAIITLPKNTSGILLWNNTKEKLKEGVNELQIK